MRIFRTPAGMRIAAVFANILANAFIAALLPRLAAVCYGDPKAGVIGGALWILSMRLLPQWDVSNTILGLLCFCLLTALMVSSAGKVARGRPVRALWVDCFCC